MGGLTYEKPPTQGGCDQDAQIQFIFPNRHQQYVYDQTVYDAYKLENGQGDEEVFFDLKRSKGANLEGFKGSSSYGRYFEGRKEIPLIFFC